MRIVGLLEDHIQICAQDILQAGAKPECFAVAGWTWANLIREMIGCIRGGLGSFERIKQNYLYWQVGRYCAGK